MKNIAFIFLCSITGLVSFAQNSMLTDQQRKDIITVIDQYALAREERDTTLLKKILTDDVDQLVSNGEWRYGISSAIEGMLKSSATQPGKRTLTVNNIRLLDTTTCIVDCRYVIQNDDGTTRNMWSTFMLISANKYWKISAIRNMLPAK